MGTVLFTTETFTIVIKLFGIHTVNTSDIENPLDERQASPQEINGFCEQLESNVNETEQVKKFDETEKSIKEISEDQEEKLNEGNKSSPGNVREDSEDQEEKLNVGDKFSSGKVKDDSEDQAEKLHQGNKSSPGNVRDGSEEEEETPSEGNTPSSRKVREDREEQEEELDQGNKSSQRKLRKQYKVRAEKWLYRLAVLLLILTGFFEDFPVVLLTFYTAVAVVCGTPARQEVGSVATMVTIISAMMNSLWTMIILFCELCGCRKFYTNISYRSCVKVKRTFKSLWQDTCCQRSTNSRLSKHRCKDASLSLAKHYCSDLFFCFSRVTFLWEYLP